MLIIHHRRNTKKLLKDTPYNCGVEIDIRSFGDKLILNHDPFENAINFEEWLNYFNHKFLILNLKEEGLVEKIIALMRTKNINNFFFLDQSFPEIFRTFNMGERRTAVRVSEYESIETALNLSGLVDWVWIDFFSILPLDFDGFMKLKEAGFKLCLVSPELQGHEVDLIHSLKTQMSNSKIYFDAVCTKEIDLWTD